MKAMAMIREASWGEDGSGRAKRRTERAISEAAIERKSAS